MKTFLDSWQWMGRVGDAEEVGHACLFLASDQASYITGVELIVSGGQELGHGLGRACPISAAERSSPQPRLISFPPLPARSAPSGRRARARGSGCGCPS